MSFKQNDTNTSITPANYEEFFILYMDNELSKEQMGMVDEFLKANPDLLAEFDMLASLKLPVEDLSFNKEELLAENMKRSLVDEELFLYLDNELPADRKQLMERRLASDKAYQAQHQLLLQTRLDPAEIISYPDKKELYRRTERRVIAFRPWMRVAAAAVIIAASGIVYFANTPSGPSSVQPTIAQTKKTTAPEKKPAASKEMVPESLAEQEVASASREEKHPGRETGKEQKKKTEQDNQPLIAKALQEPPEEIMVIPGERVPVKKTSVDAIALADPSELKPDPRAIASLVPNKVFINNGAVTNTSSERNINIQPAEPNGSVADRKGSVKGFLRKATRLIEKRTGFDPTNDNGELLVGIVAVKLK
jgi:hypothetical protein